ncbi:bacteriophage replication A domain protein [Escherichia coli]|nr:bacteriophage replication A domain protein [Escherichia coli]
MLLTDLLHGNTQEEPRETVFRQNTLTGAVLRDISRNTFQKTSTAMHWMVSSITTPAGR